MSAPYTAWYGHQSIARGETIPAVLALAEDVCGAENFRAVEGPGPYRIRVTHGADQREVWVGPIDPDACACGDSRPDHDSDGRCRVCFTGRDPWDGCTQFRPLRASLLEHHRALGGAR